MPSQAWAQPLPKLWMSSKALYPADIPPSRYRTHSSRWTLTMMQLSPSSLRPSGPKVDLLAAIREVGALMQTAGVKNTQVNEWVYRSLAALDNSDEKAAEQLTEAPAIKAALA